MAWATRHGFMSSEWRRVATLATAAACYGLAVPLGGSGFIAAFAGGLVFGWLNHEEVAPLTELVDRWRRVVRGVDVRPVRSGRGRPPLHRVDAAVAIYAALSLTVVRMLPVAVALLGSHARLPTVGFIGWFGPRGLASIVFVVIAADEPALSGASQITVIVSATVLASVYLHGLTAVPLAARYANWYEAHPRPSSLWESGDAYRHPGRWHRHHTGEPPSRPPGRRPDG